MVITTAESAETGSNLRIQVMTSSPESYVALQAIDKSVLLLQSGNDITKERVSKWIRIIQRNYNNARWSILDSNKI